jgi:hypothetical protein
MNGTYFMVPFMFWTLGAFNTLEEIDPWPRHMALDITATVDLSSEVTGSSSTTFSGVRKNFKQRLRIVHPRRDQRLSYSDQCLTEVLITQTPT